jgi:hypothetical protein
MTQKILFFWLFCLFVILNSGSVVTASSYSSPTSKSPDSVSNLHSTFDIDGSILKWINLQWPATANISVGGSIDVYFQCYQEGVTESAGPGTGILAWIGYSSSNTNPNTWTNWIPANFNVQHDNNDEYMANLGSSLPQGIYYYASRFQYNGGPYQYGGYNQGGGGTWDGVNNISGVLSIGKSLAYISISNTVQAYDGKPKQVSVTTQPTGQSVQITYNGSSALPINAGSYQVVATISNPNYQGTQKGSLSIYQIPKDSLSIALRNKFIWVMYDQVYNQNDLDEALSFKPDVIERAWFKWGGLGNFDYGTWSWMVNQAHQHNSLLGGGGTMIALYPGEVDDAKFLRIVERTQFNKPMFFSGDTTSGYYFGDVQKKEYLDFLLDWLYKQIKAGANTFHLDGASAIPTLNVGYSDYSIGEFNQYLIRKYVNNLGWTINDTRWTTIFNIDRDQDCSNGTISTFDYRKYLKRNGYINDPGSFTFPLRAEWGDPWNYLNTYSGERNHKACEALYTSIKHFGDSIGKPVYVTMNGYSDYVDYQTTGVWDNWKVVNGKLDIGPSYINHWRSIKDYSLVHLNKDIPLIVFHDWGYGMPFLSDISEEDRILWLKAYTPEIFASGCVFAWPVSGGGTNYRPSKALKDTIFKLSGWYSQNRNLYLNASWNAYPGVDLKGQLQLIHTVLDQNSETGDTLKKEVHLINRNLDGNRKLVVRSNFGIEVFSPKKPKSVWAVSPDFKDTKPLLYSVIKDSVKVTVSSLEAYTVVVLDYAQKVPQILNFKPLPNQKKGIADFDPGASSSSGLSVSYVCDNTDIATIVNGKIHIVGAGTCHITASQSGNEIYEAASNVVQALSVIDASGIDDKKEIGFKIYPNPCHNSLFIEHPSKRSVHLEIFDMPGQKKMDAFLVGNELDVHLLSPGIYILKLDGISKILVKTVN